MQLRAKYSALLEAMKRGMMLVVGLVHGNRGCWQEYIGVTLWRATPTAGEVVVFRLSKILCPLCPEGIVCWKRRGGYGKLRLGQVWVRHGASWASNFSKIVIICRAEGDVEQCVLKIECKTSPFFVQFQIFGTA